MNKPVYFFVLCALLASTYIQELYAINLPNAHDRIKRSASPSSLTLQVINGLLVISNTTANAALVLDIRASLFAALNGDSGSAVVLNPSTNAGVSIPQGVWNAQESSIEDFLSSLSSSLANLLNKDGATSVSSLKSVPEDVLNDVGKTGAGLLNNLDKDLLRTPSDALQLLSDIASQLNESLNRPLKGLLEELMDKVVKPHGDLAGLVNTVKGLGEVLDALHESVESLVDQGVKLNSEDFFQASDGLEVLFKLFQMLTEAKIDLSPIVGLTGSIDDLSTLIGLLGGNFPVGVNGLFQILEEITKIPAEPTSIMRLINDLITYTTQTPKEVVNNLHESGSKEINQVLEVLEEAGASKNFSVLVGVLGGILNHTLVANGVNLSNIIDNLLIDKLEDSEPLPVIVEVLASLEPMVTPVQAIPYLLVILIAKLDSEYGIQQLQYLNIPVSIDTDNIQGSILKYVLASAGDIQGLATGNLYDGLVMLKVIKDIVKRLEVNVKEADASLDLKSLLDSNVDVQKVIKGLVQFLSGVDVGASSSDLTVAAEALAESSNVKSLVHIHGPVWMG